MFYTNSNFTIPQNWEYRGEGNCHIVISLPKQRKILRVRKENKSSKSILRWILKWITDIFYWYVGNPTDDESRDLKFYQNVIRPLLGNNFVCKGEQILLSKKQVKVLQRKLRNKRPDSRKHKSLQNGRAALFDDYAFLPDRQYPFRLAKDIFAVEIKPKQGWSPFSESHYPKCIFCMNQYMKREKGQIDKLSMYCPLDLFSGESGRIIKALRNLSRNPQNNLKVFKNGQLCYGETFEYEKFENVISQIFTNCDNGDQDESTLELFNLIQSCLLSRNFYEVGPECNLKKFCEWNKIIQDNCHTRKLPLGCVLERILSMQMLDVEGHQYYYKLLSSNKSNSNVKKISDYNYVRRLLKELENGDEGTCLKCKIMMLANRRDDLVFVPYLISAIAKDCSLMITFQKIIDDSHSESTNVVETKFGRFLVNVGVFDLYPKPISTIFKHKKRIQTMLELCTNNHVIE